jgi:type II secretory pathway component PulF
LTKGYLLSEACQDYNNIFSPPLLALIKAGEKSGQFAHICRQCYIYLSQSQEQRVNIFKTLAYPLLNLGAFCVTLFILGSVILPDVIWTLKESNQEIPTITKFLVFLFQLSWDYILMGIGMIGLAFFSISYGRELIAFRIFGCFILPIHYARIFSTLNLLMQEKIPLITSLSIVCKGISHSYLQKIFHIILKEVQEGKKFYQALKKLPYFSSLYLQLIKAGEMTGNQQDSMIVATQLMVFNTRQLIDRLLFWASPLFMSITGILFWLLIEGIFIPLYDKGVFYAT